MNTNEAKEINLLDLMARMGYQPSFTRKGGHEYWYHSPFRAEKHASFHATFLKGKWVWKDFGDVGGTVIDFVMRHENYHKVSDALQYLAQFSGTLKNNHPSVFSHQQNKTIAETRSTVPNELEFIAAKKIEHPLILKYLTQQRKINPTLALHYLEEVKYKNIRKQKNYFAFGMKNQSQGYEIRVASDEYPFKSSLLKKDISLIQGANPRPKIINLFEGMLDFLSLLTMMKTDQLVGDSIVLHSTALLDKAIAYIQQQGYKHINGYLDNDDTGQQASQKLQSEFGDLFFDQRSLFVPFGDLNEMKMKL